MSNFHLTVSIVCYHTPLESLQRNVDELSRVENLKAVIIVDNSSFTYFDESDFITSKDILIFRNSNTGYVAHNLGLKCALSLDSSIHLIMNSDIHLPEGSLHALISVLESNPTIDAIFPKVIFPDGSSQLLAKHVPSAIDLFLRMLGFQSKYSKLVEPSFSKDPVHVGYISGCFMLFRREIIEKIGMMDERFFMYGEDIDYSRRIATNGVLIYYPSVEIIHEYGGASKKSLRMFLIHFFNVVKYFNKWGWFFDRERRRINLKFKKKVDLVFVKNRLDKIDVD